MTNGRKFSVIGQLVGGSALALILAAAPAHAQDFTKSFTVGGRPNVRVETNDGSVRVSTSDSKQVEVRIMYQGYELNKNLRIDANQDGDKVTVSARVAGNWGIHINWGNDSRRMQIEVRMPKDGDLTVESGDGSVEASALSGRVAIHTGDGAIKGNGLSGVVDLHTSDGSITVDSVKGDIRLKSGDGNIEGHNMDGKCDAYTGDGHIRLAGRFDDLAIHSGDGNVETRAMPGSKINSAWNIRTGDGSVELTLPADFQANIDASTGDGHISMGLPVTVEGTFSNSQIHGKMNGGGQQLTIHTGDGSIRLSKG